MKKFIAFLNMILILVSTGTLFYILKRETDLLNSNLTTSHQDSKEVIDIKVESVSSKTSNITDFLPKFKTNSTPTIKNTNSPLELSDIEKLNDLKNIIELIDYNIIIYIILAYLLFSAIFIFTIKLLVDSNINVDLLLKYPGGKIIHYILSKLLKVWNINNTFWIYFILFIAFLGSCFTTYSIYICSIVLQIIFKF
jgi:hypothetical protein